MNGGVDLSTTSNSLLEYLLARHRQTPDFKSCDFGKKWGGAFGEQENNSYSR